MFKGAFNGFSKELLEEIRERQSERISDAAYEERICGIEKATVAMIEAGVEEEVVIKMLQKYWRLSEATEVVENGIDSLR